jgi:ribose transport system substrate-binding protein
MRTSLSFALIVFVLAGMAGPVAAQGTAAGGKPHYIGYCLPTTQGPFMSMLAEQVTAKFKSGGQKIEYVSADNSAAKQLEQIENFVTMGVDELVIMAVDPSSLSDTLSKAMKKGVKVVAFSMETKAYDVFIGTDEHDVGVQIGSMASEWIDKTFPTAKPGSVEVAIFEYRGTSEATKRSDGMQNITKINPKVKLVKTVGIDTTTAGAQSAAENLFLTNKNVKVVLCYNSDTASGVNAYAMAQNSAVKDKGKFACFGCDWNDEAGAKIKASKAGSTVFRGTIRMGASLEQLFQDVYDNSMVVFGDKAYNKRKLTELYKITAYNIDQMTK